MAPMVIDKPVSEEVLAQQQIADTFCQLKLVPDHVRVADAVWQAGKFSSLLRKNCAMDRCAQDCTNHGRQPK